MFSKKSKAHIIDHDRTQLVLKKTFDGEKFSVHSRQIPDQRAAFAMELLRVHAGITGRSDDTEDSAGRAKMRRDLPAEAVAYACDVASRAFDEFGVRGWLIPVPGWEEIEELAKPEN